MRKWIFFLALMGTACVSWGQFTDVDFKVYDFDEGLSHRNVFKVQQDSLGFIWAATINGLNRFDGYQFVQYSSRHSDNYIPSDVITDLFVDEKNRLWMAHPDQLSILDIESNTVDTLWIKEGDFVRRESQVPYHMVMDDQERLWMDVYDEKTAVTSLQLLHQDEHLSELIPLEGQYTGRAMVKNGSQVFLAAFENELWQFNREGELVDKFHLSSGPGTRIVELQILDNELWVLTISGKIYRFDPEKATFLPHPINTQLPSKLTAGCFLVEENGDIWVGGQGVLWHFDARSERLIDYDAPIRQIVKNTCSYRQVFKDQMDVIWVASNFGLIKIVQSDNLFTHYLSGGSEYCSNVYCSTRGIAEDEDKNIYISYYNSIHVLDPFTNSLRLLFPANDYFNYPFGLTYHKGALWTGNGWRIDLETLDIDTIFKKPNIDLGTVIPDRDGELWFGYLHWLYRYDVDNEILSEFEDQQGKWDTLDGEISYLYQGKTNDYLWISTLNNGLYKVSKTEGRLARYYQGSESSPPLAHNKVNATYEDKHGRLWIATGDGLHMLDIAADTMARYTSEHGLPNNFINGLLSEGDSVMWVSTDNGLCRFSLQKSGCLNFFQQDGLSSNEFNRISFFKAGDGRMYFGGLDGVNAFYPGSQFLEKKEERQEAELIFTNFTKYDGAKDSLYTRNHGLSDLVRVVLSPYDKIFSFSFALADFRQPLDNQFSYILEDYDQDWSEASSINLVRYHNIPAGEYTFRVRARSGRDEWNRQELRISLKVQEAFYRTWWFWGLCASLLMGLIYGIMRYRIHLVKEREHKLEEQVRIRTEELQKEKQLSEELLLNILPEDTAEELKKYGTAKAKRHEEVTVMFSDFKGFTKISNQLEPEQLVAEIDLCFSAFDEIMEKYKLEKIKTIGDAYLCVGGIAVKAPGEASRVVEAAIDIQAYMEELAQEKMASGETYFEARIGIHTGPVVAGIVGIKKFAYDIWGDTVNIASRLESNGQVGRVNISETTYQRIKDYFECSYHGNFELHDNESVKMYFVERYVGKDQRPLPPSTRS